MKRWAHIQALSCLPCLATVSASGWLLTLVEFRTDHLFQVVLRVVLVILIEATVEQNPRDEHHARVETLGLIAQLFQQQRAIRSFLTGHQFVRAQSIIFGTLLNVEPTKR